MEPLAGSLPALHVADWLLESSKQLAYKVKMLRSGNCRIVILYKAKKMRILRNCYTFLFLFFLLQN